MVLELLAMVRVRVKVQQLSNLCMTHSKQQGEEDIKEHNTHYISNKIQSTLSIELSCMKHNSRHIVNR